MKKFLGFSLLLFAAMWVRSQNIVQAEYFIDADLGVGKNQLVTLTPSPDGGFPVPVSLAGIAAGIHQLYIRTRDSNGSWSLTTRRNIEVPGPAVTTVSGGEYFYDSDPGFGAATPIVIAPADSAILQNFASVTASLSTGYHKLYIRARDSKGRWGQTARRNVEVVKAPVFVVKGAEYFFTADPGAGGASPVSFANGAADGSFTFKIPLENIPTGATTLYVRAKDSVNQSWSLTAWATDSVITSVKTGLWSDVNTWSNHKIPVSSTVVILHHDVIVDIDAFCRSLVPFRHDVHVTVNQGKILNISGH